MATPSSLPPAPSSLDSRYLPHVNGLRALAILGVLIYHLRADYCPAGYFGVDLFLVISGFLLFRSLLKPGAEQGFHYGSYLLKKLWRIFPAWFVVTFIACALTVYLLAPTRAGDILKTARSSALFYADYHIDHSGDYFNVFSQQNPLLHYWYLSITCQIYLLAPLLLIPLARWCSRKAAIILLAALSLLSFVWYILTTSRGIISESLQQTLLLSLGMKTAYYHLIPRFWEFAAGFGVFLLPEFANRPRLRATLGLLGLAGVIVSFYLYTTGSPAIYLTVAASLLALRYGSTGVAAHLLNLRPVQALGTISFSLYLWHWPIMVFWKYLCMDSLSPWNEAALIVVCLLVGALGWRFIESIRTPSCSGWKGTLQRCSLLLTIPIILIAAPKVHKYVKKHVVSNDTIPASVVETDAALLRGIETLPDVTQPADPPLIRLGDASQPASFLFMGDSHARHLSRDLDLACQREGLRGVYLGASVSPCHHLIVYKTSFKAAYWDEKLSNLLLSYLQQQPGIRYVIMSDWWEMRLCDTTGRNWSTGEPIRNRHDCMKLASTGLGEWCDRLRAIGKVPILLEDNPSFDLPSPIDEWERYQELTLLQKFRPYRERQLTQQEYEKRQEFSLGLMKKLAAEGRAHVIDISPPLRKNGVYPARINGEFLYSDNNHLSPAGSRRVVEHLMPRLLDIMKSTAVE